MEARYDETVAAAVEAVGVVEAAGLAGEEGNRVDPGEGMGPTDKTAQKMWVRLGLLKWDLDTRIHHLSHVDRSMPEDGSGRDVRTRHLEVGAGRRGGTHPNEDV